MKLDPIIDVVDAFRAGKPVVMIDDADRENEGDLTIAAECATPELINFMIQHGKGLICLSLDPVYVKRLGLSLQVADNKAVFGTNFTESIDHRSVGSDGVSAAGRARTILETVAENAQPEDFVSPGFIFPLHAKAGGVFERRGQTEGSVDLARLAGLKPAGVICEIMSEHGVMIRGQALVAYCRQHGLLLTSVEAIREFRLEHEFSLRREAEVNLGKLEIENFLSGVEGLSPELHERANAIGLRAIVYRDYVENSEQLAFIFGNPEDGCHVRVHSECLTGDVFESRRCDCGFQFAHACARMIEAGSGVLIYMQQEGRGIGLANKMRAYQLQEQGADTVEANEQLGFRADERNYRAAGHILADLQIGAVSLLTNNPKKCLALQESGVQVIERIGIQAPVDVHSLEYVCTKGERLGHDFPNWQALLSARREQRVLKQSN